MSDIRLNIPVGEVLEVSTSGTYIAVKSANVKLDVHVDGEGTQILSQGDAWHIDNGFNSFTVENYGMVDAVVLLAVGRGSFRAGQLVGTIDSLNTIVNPVTVSPHNINTIVNPVTVNHVPPHEYPSHYQLFLGVPVNNAIVLPAANINGIIASNINIMSSGGVTAAFMLHTAPPINPVDNAVKRILARSSGGWISNQMSIGEVFIPAGLGLYLVSNGSVMASLDYEVL